MRKASLVSLGVLFLALFAAPAFAGTVNEIVLGGSSGAPVVFTGTGGGGFNVTFNVKNLIANGSGTLLSTGFYSIVNNGAYLRNAGSCGSGCFTLSQGSPLLFSYGSTPNGNDLLTGNLWFTDLVQTQGGTGVFNDSLMINFVVTGGSLAGAFGNSNGMIQLTIKFTTSQNLATILKNQQLMAKIVSGGVFPVPEPASLAILGASLLGLVGLGKKKKLFAS
jgi:hypothetical protein